MAREAELVAAAANSRVDMSPAAIEQRLEEVGQLYELGLYLAQAKPVSPSVAEAVGQTPGLVQRDYRNPAAQTSAAIASSEPSSSADSPAG